MLSPHPLSSCVVLRRPAGKRQRKARIERMGRAATWASDLGRRKRASRISASNVLAYSPATSWLQSSLKTGSPPSLHDSGTSPCRSASLKRTSLCPVMNRNGNAEQLSGVGRDHDFFLLIDRNVRVLDSTASSMFAADLRDCSPSRPTRIAAARTRTRSARGLPRTGRAAADSAASDPPVGTRLPNAIAPPNAPSRAKKARRVTGRWASIDMRGRRRNR
jgi:hypothetical protein